METIQSQLLKIKQSVNDVEEIVSNYKIGLISISEMWGQINCAQDRVECIKSDIQLEYGINRNAVNLMLNL
jgi:hypothetical protein